jgi:futalosine hydrolase
MNLIVAATNKEIKPFFSALETSQTSMTFVSGVGCFETTLNLTRFFCRSNRENITRVVHVGIAGAFQNGGAAPLDICVAKEEIFADFGICCNERIESFNFAECPETTQFLNESCVKELNHFFEQQGIPYVNGTFLTVNSVSGTGKRGDYLQKKHHALCENMEGFAVARVCKEFQIPCLEVRCVSNLVEDRNRSNWVIDEACEKLGQSLVPFLS